MKERRPFKYVFNAIHHRDRWVTGERFQKDEEMRPVYDEGLQRETLKQVQKSLWRVEQSFSLLYQRPLSCAFLGAAFGSQLNLIDFCSVFVVMETQTCDLKSV